MRICIEWRRREGDRRAACLRERANSDGSVTRRLCPPLPSRGTRGGEQAMVRTVPLHECEECEGCRSARVSGGCRASSAAPPSQYGKKKACGPPDARPTYKTQQQRCDFL
ncbi:hypothetical protein MRX96_010061 [Rhipicephalus microplus]